MKYIFVVMVIFAIINVAFAEDMKSLKADRHNQLSNAEKHLKRLENMTQEQIKCTSVMKEFNKTFKDNNPMPNYADMNDHQKKIAQTKRKIAKLKAMKDKQIQCKEVLRALRSKNRKASQ